MKTTTQVLSIFLILSFVSCSIPGKNPCYFEDQLFTDDLILGEWVELMNPSSSFSIREDENDEMGYILEFNDKEGRESQFSLHLADLGDFMMLDLFSIAMPEYDLQDSSAYPFLRFHYGHFSYLLDEISEDAITIKVFYRLPVDELKENYPVEEFTLGYGTEVVQLDIPTAELQEIYREYLDAGNILYPVTFYKEENLEENIRQQFEAGRN